MSLRQASSLFKLEPRYQMRQHEIASWTEIQFIEDALEWMKPVKDNAEIKHVVDGMQTGNTKTNSRYLLIMNIGIATTLLN